MKFATAIVAAAVAAVSSAQSTLNTPWNFSPEGACVANYHYETDNDSQGFRNELRTCMLGCPKTQADAYRANFFDKFMWYHSNKPAPITRRHL
ncbi:hypothetical protein CPB97_002300 [Podila verticillata]|nr:hypothetical protein CPB97_002300 [Podila verticillata]